MTGRRFSRRILEAAPLGLLLVIALCDVLLLGSRNVVLGLVVMVPLLAANFVGPRLTAWYGILAFVTAVLLGFADQQYEAGTWPSQAVRLVAVAVGGIGGVLASAYREHREARLAQVIRVAEVAQRAILIPVPPELNGVRLAVHYESAASEAVIGGDLYAAVSTRFGLRVLVGDVRGKGLDAVRLASQVLAAFRERAADRDDLEALSEDLDRAVRRTAGPEDFVTAVLAQIRPDGGLTLVNAGHPAPFLARGRRLTVLEPPEPRPPLGLDGRGTVQQLTLTAEDRLLFYTDGLTEARRPDDRHFLSDERIADVFMSAPTLQDSLAAVRTALLEWTGGHLTDDVALVAAELAGPPERRG